MNIDVEHSAIMQEVLPAADAIPAHYGFVLIVVNDDNQLAYISNMGDTETVTDLLEQVTQQIVKDTLPVH